MPTPQKEARVAALVDSIAESAGFYLCDFSGIDAERMNALRTAVYSSGGRVEVVKNRLLRLALSGTAAEELVDTLTGPTAVAFCPQDAISPAKAMKDFSKALPRPTDRWEIKAAYVDGRVFRGAHATALADLPPVDEIKGAAVGAIAGPLNGLVGTLNAALSDLVFTLQAVAEKREEQAA